MIIYISHPRYKEILYCAMLGVNPNQGLIITNLIRMSGKCWIHPGFAFYSVALGRSRWQAAALVRGGKNESNVSTLSKKIGNFVAICLLIPIPRKAITVCMF